MTNSLGFSGSAAAQQHEALRRLRDVVVKMCSSAYGGGVQMQMQMQMQLRMQAKSSSGSVRVS